MEVTDTLNTRRKRFIMIIIMLCNFEIFTSCQGSMRTFSKHYPKRKRVSIKFRKTLQDRRLPTLKISQDNPQYSFLNFLTSENVFITLQYSGNILGIFLKHTLVKCSSNILETLAVFTLSLHKYDVYIKCQVLHYKINVKTVKKFMFT